MFWPWPFQDATLAAYKGDLQWTLGLETNLALAGSGQFDWLLIPQMQWEITDHVMLQEGVGARVANGGSTAEAAIRLIRSF